VSTRVADLVAALVRRVVWAFYVRRSRRALLSLDDHTLKDIGLTRFDAWRESNRALFDLETSPPPCTAAGQAHGENLATTPCRERRAAFKYLR